MTPVLEDRLRDLFGATTQTAPSPDDPASRAMARARVIRKRRLTLASAAAAVLLGGSVYGLTALQPGRGVSPTSMLPNGALTESYSPVPAPPAVADVRRDGAAGRTLDVRAGDRMWTTGGSVVELSGVGHVTRAYRVPMGWIYGGEQGVRLMLLSDGTTRALTGEGERWALDPAGERITFVAGGRLHVGAVTRNGLAVTGGVPIAEGVHPVGFAGDRVLVRDGDAGYALVDPAAPVLPSAPPEPVFDARLLTVFGPAAGGALTALVREPGSDRVCLARLETTAAALTVVGAPTGCDLGLDRAGDAGARLSADGSRLYQADADAYRVIDVASGRETARCAARTGTTAVWLTGDRLAAGTDGRSVTCGPDGARETAALPDGVTTGWQYVPRLGGD